MRPLDRLRLLRGVTETRRRAALGFASAASMACLACAAYADSVAPASWPATLAADEFMETSVGAGAVPTGVWDPLDAFPLLAPSFRAEASPGTGAAPAAWFGFLGANWQSPNLLGDMGGLRPALAKYGVTLSIVENVETFGNLTGGVRQGFEVNGLTTATLQLDTQKAFGLNGGTFNISGLQIWGGNLTADNLLILHTLTDIEAPVGIRLWELWYQQKFGDKFDIKFGEQSLDQEFIISPSSQFFINSVSGWPALPTVDLPGDGPAYPLAGLGVRGRAQVTDNLTVLAGLFNGSPIPKNSPNTALSNPYGVSFPLNTGVLAIAELQFMFPGSGVSAKGGNEGPLPGTYKLGAWYDSESFNDLQYDNMGVPLASPASNGVPLTHHGDFSIYGIIDQMIWRSKDDSSRSLNVFIRPMFTPLQDRNLVSASFGAGFTLHGALPGRDNDSFGAETGIARASNGASGYDRDLQFYQPSAYTPVRSAETFVEATYQVQVTPWWQIQPDIQYVFNPGAGIADPEDPTQKIKNEFVVGLRTNITF
jgi:porin